MLVIQIKFWLIHTTLIYPILNSLVACGFNIFIFGSLDFLLMILSMYCAG